MTTFLLIADQLAQALRELQKAVLEFLIIPSAANRDELYRCESVACITLAAYDAARTIASGTTHSEECWRWHPECAQGRVEELERTVAAYRQAIEAAKIEWTLSYAMCRWIENRVDELLKENSNG